MSVKVDASGFFKKMKKLKGMGGYWSNIHLDAASFFNIRMTNKIIGGQYVGVISGNLRRSHRVKKISDRASGIRVAKRIAPYQPFVRQWTAGQRQPSGASQTRNQLGRSPGKDYVKITFLAYGKQLNNLAINEAKRAVKIIENGGNYKYKNPYPARK